MPLVWKGNGTSHTWNNTAGNPVWLDGGTPAGWGDTDTATFDDTGSNSPGITISGTVQPSAVTVDSSKNYTFTGTGRYRRRLVPDQIRHRHPLPP